jgi:conjugal transfer mating pair stabilization protein TraG
MMYSIMTMGGNEVVVDVLNAVAAAVGKDSFHSLLRLGVLFGLMWVLCHFLIKGSPMVLLSWFSVVFLLYNLILVPKIKIQVIDTVTHQETAVDNVPLGVGFLASVTSTVGHSLTQLFEPLFTIPEDLSYSKTGFVMGARLVDESRRLHIHDSAFLNDLHHFMQQCVWYDVARGKYSLDDLFNAEETQGDLWAFMVAHASPLQAFTQNNEIVTCKDGVTQLAQHWQQEILYGQSQLGQRLFHHANPDQARAMVISQLPLAITYLTGISQSANQLVQQNLLMNALETSLAHHAAGIGATAAITHYATFRANQQVRSQFSVSYAMATHWLPIAKIVIEALLIGGFLLVAVIMLLPGGTKTLLFYAKSLLWIELWAPLYAILHGMMMAMARHGSGSILDLYETTSINAFTWSGIVSVNHDIALYAGYATLLIPLIAWGLVNGAGFTVTAIASSMIGMAQGGAQRASDETTSGNLGFGNLNYGNTMAQNTSNHHWNTRAEFQDLGFTEQLPEGSQLTTMQDGGVVMDNQPALSHLAVSGDFANRLSHVSQQQYEKSVSALETSSQQYSVAVSHALHQMTEFGKNMSHSLGDNQSWQHSRALRLTNALQTIEQLNERFAKSEHISTIKAQQVLGEWYFNADLQLHSRDQKHGQAFANLTGISAGLSGGKRHAQINQSTDEEQTLRQHAKEFVRETQYQASMDDALQQVAEWGHHTSDDTAMQMVKQFSASLDKVGAVHNDVAQHWQEAQGYHDLAQRAKEDSFTINSNANQAFMTWLANTQKLSVTEAESMLLHEPTRAHQYWQQFAKAQITHLTQQANLGMAGIETIQSRYANNAILFDQAQDKLIDKHHDTRVIIENYGKEKLSDPSSKTDKQS